MENVSDSSSTVESNSSRHNPSDQYLKHLNRISQKITKPPISGSKVPLRHQQPAAAAPQQQQQQHVYNIDKTDFKEVVQRLTGSAPSPTTQSPKPSSSRLERIRPPPLAHLTDSRPPPLNYTHNSNATAESPVSAYMRYLQSSAPTPTQNLLLPSPNFAMPTWQNVSAFPMPNSTFGFGQILSPRSPQYSLFSPSSFYSPTTIGQWGFPQFPQSPRLPVLSPR